MRSHRKRWHDRVAAAVTRVVRRSGNRAFSRDELIRYELDQIVEETGSIGQTPEQTLSRVLQELRNDGQTEFISSGECRVVVDEVR